jgi:hypothetical protein
MVVAFTVRFALGRGDSPVEAFATKRPDFNTAAALLLISVA